VHVAALVKSYGTSFENAFNAFVEFESGATGVLLANWVTGTRTHTWELHGAGISAFVDADREARVFTDNGREPAVRTAAEVANSDAQHHTYSFFGESRHFINCIRSDRTPITHFGDAVKTMELIDAINGSDIG